MLNHVYATTILQDESGGQHPYWVHFTVDQKGQICFLREYGDLKVHAHMLLHLAYEVYKCVGINPDDFEVNVPQYRRIGHRLSHHPSLEFGSSRRFRLDRDVDGVWLSTSYLPAMVKYIHQLITNESWEPLYDYAFIHHIEPYRLLNPAFSAKWSFWLQ